MQFSDETLMAYADGELTGEACAALERAVRDDAALAARVQQLRQQREILQRAFAGVLDEPVPPRLAAMAATAPAGPSAGAVTDLAARRHERAQRRRWSLPEFGAIAASLIVGILAGRTLLPGDSLLALGDDGLMARDALARALSEQPGGTSAGDIATQITFRAQDGQYCRTFTVRDTAPLAGIACRSGSQWRVDTLLRAPTSTDPQYRMAGSSLPEPLLQAARQMMVGDALDADEEQAARASGWVTQK